MKTKQLFITLISSTLLMACTTDDSVLEQETVALEATEQQAKDTTLTHVDGIDIEPPSTYSTFYCKLGRRAKIFYYTTPVKSFNSLKMMFLERDKMILLERDWLFNDILFNPDTLGGCKKYMPPKTLNIKYDITRNQYYEVWHLVEVVSNEPIGDQDDVEL